MKKLVFLATTLLMFLAITVNAQQRGPRERMTPEQQATRTVERLTTELKLTDKQQADLKKMVYRIVQKARRSHAAKPG